MTENEESAYINGKTTALKEMIRTCQSSLKGYGIELKTKEEFSIERIDVIRTLRSICSEYGDNDWNDDLHISDIIEKHICWESFHD